MIEFKEVAMSFDNGLEKKVAFHPSNLIVNEGDFICVVGGNGAGKSTLLNLINGNLKPSEGSIKIDNQEIEHLSRYKRANFIASVFQDPNAGVCPELSIAQNMAMAYDRGKRRGFRFYHKKANLDVFAKKLETLERGLEHRMNQRVDLLSGGQRQALTLMMATLHKPKLLLLDEHTAALDPPIARQVMSLTNEIVTKDKITTIMITHNLKDALVYGNRLIMFKEGRIVLDVSGQDKANLNSNDLLELFE